MNGRRWLIMWLFLVGLTSLGLVAQGQEKTTKKTTEAEKKTTEAEKKTTQAEKKTTEPEKKATTAEKKGGEEGGTKLTLKAFEGKEPFFQELNTTTTQNMTVMQQKITQQQQQTFWFSWTPKEHKDSTYTVVQKILGVKMDIDIGGNKISFDSRDKEKPKNPMTEFFGKLVGTEFTLTIAPNKEGRLAVEKVEGVKKFVDELGSVNQAMMPLLKKILTDESIKSMAEPMLGVIPANGSVPGSKTWTSENTLNMGPIGEYKTTNKYTYEGAADSKNQNLVKIKVDSDLAYSPPTGDQKGAGLPFVIVNDKDATKLKSKDSGGTIIFNLEKGRVESAKMNVKLNGTLKIDIANMQTTVDLDQTQVSELRTFDTNPIEAKK